MQNLVSNTHHLKSKFEVKSCRSRAYGKHFNKVVKIYLNRAIPQLQKDDPER